jgi:outer membrane protein TolC
MTGWARWVAATALLLAASGCLSMRSVDGSVHGALRGEAARSLPDGSNTLTDAMAEIRDGRKAAPTIALDLTNALVLATQYSRSLQTKRERLYLSALSALGAFRQFGPQYASTVDYVMSWPDRGSDQSTVTGKLKASQVLPFGGTVALEGGTVGTETAGGTNDAAYRTTAGMEVRQPLLAGAGYESSHDALIQSRRDLVYALRAFAQERQDFAIGIMRAYFNLLLKKDVVANTRQNVDQSTFLRRRSEALFRIRRAPSIDVLRSQQQELSASNVLSQTESDYEIGLSRFLIEVGLPVNTRLEVAGTMPEKIPQVRSMESSLRLALERRLDLQTVRDRREDASRAVRVARNAMLPKMDAYGKAGASGEADGPEFPDAGMDYSAGITLNLPLDQRNERDAVRRATVALSAAERDLDEKSDTVRVEITDSFSKLEALSATVEIERRNIDLAQRRADYAAFRFRNGELSNRDVVEAQNELLTARNAYAGALVHYELQRVQLLRDVGLLDVGPDGRLIELAEP